MIYSFLSMLRLVGVRLVSQLRVKELSKGLVIQKRELIFEFECSFLFHLEASPSSPGAFYTLIAMASRLQP